MGMDVLQFLSSPAGLFLVVLNSVLATVIAITGFFVLRNAGLTLRQNSEANSLVVQQASKLADTANDALRELTKNIATTIESTQRAVTSHNTDSAERHRHELSIQQQIADTLANQTEALNTQSETIKRQTALMSSQVSIMQDMSKSDQHISETIETRIAPEIEALRRMMQELVAKFENFSPDELKATLGTISQTLDHLVAIVEREDEPHDKQDVSSDRPDRLADAASGDDPGAGAGDTDDPAAG